MPVSPCDGCDGIQIVFNDGTETELHHAIPDDQAEHLADLDCPCSPPLEWLEHDLAVVLHVDQDTGHPVPDRAQR
jgi:hypothetical protein